MASVFCIATLLIVGVRNFRFSTFLILVGVPIIVMKDFDAFKVSTLLYDQVVMEFKSSCKYSKLILEFYTVLRRYICVSSAY